MPQASTASGKDAPAPPAQALLRSFDINSRITLYLLAGLDQRAWRAEPAGGKGRDIAGIFCHIHGVRLMWLKAASNSALPAPLIRETATVAETRQALEESAIALRVLLAAALESDGRIKHFKPDATAFIGYLIAHEAHHRGQISLLARLAGYPLAKSINFGMWEWGAR